MVEEAGGELVDDVDDEKRVKKYWGSVVDVLSGHHGYVIC